MLIFSLNLFLPSLFTGWWFVSSAEQQGWVPATYLDSQNATRDDLDLGTFRTGEGQCRKTQPATMLLSTPTHTELRLAPLQGCAVIKLKC